MDKVKKFAPVVSRYLLGALYFMAGITGLLNLVPPPTDLPQAMLDFMNGMMATKYFFPLLKSTETLCGLLLLIRVAPALSLVILTPISINIFFTHAFVTPGIENLVVPIIIIVLHATAATQYWNRYKPLFAR